MNPRFLYETFFGRLILKILTRPFVSYLAGKYMDSSLSKSKIKSFIRKNSIDMSDYVEREYVSFNDFFTREIRKDARSIDTAPASFISPCDGMISAYTICDDSSFEIKGSTYTLDELFDNKDIKSEFAGGTMIIIRLTVTDYHRYIYPDNGYKEKNIYIPGIFHTVQPIAQTRYKIYKTNSREYTILHTENFGDVIQMEVGAMMVGKILNYHSHHRFVRGEEKGRFEFGGSTVVLLTKKNAITLNKNIPINTDDETVVKMGEKIGEKFRKDALI